MNAADRIDRIERPAGIIHIVESPLGIDGAILEEIEKPACLIKQPTAVIGPRAPIAECCRFTLYAHAILPRLFCHKPYSAA